MYELTVFKYGIAVIESYPGLTKEAAENEKKFVKHVIALMAVFIIVATMTRGI